MGINATFQAFSGASSPANPIGQGPISIITPLTIAGGGTQNLNTTQSNIIAVYPVTQVAAGVAAGAINYANTASSAGIISTLSSTGSSYLQINNTSTTSATGTVTVISLS